MRAALLSLLLSAAGVAAGADLFISGATIHTLEDAGVIEEGDILIRNGRIEAVGRRLEAPAGIRRIEARGRHVTPGLFPAYTNLGIVEIELVAETAEMATVDRHFGASFRIAPALNPRSTLVPQNRVNGITHAIVAPEPGHQVLAGQGAAVRLTRAAGFTLNDSVAVFAAIGAPVESLDGGSRAAGFAHLRQGLLEAREFSRNRAAFLRGETHRTLLPVHDLEALVPVIEGKKPLVVSAHRASDIESLLALSRELSFRLVVAGASEAWIVAEQLAAAKVPVIIDPLSNLPSSFDRLGARLDNAALLHRAGVTILFSPPGYLGTHGAWLVRQGAGNAAAWGLPPEEALKAMTLNPARVFGLADRFGSIAPGKEADLVIWNGDPLELVTRAEAVLIAGEEMPMVSRATRLRDRYLGGDGGASVLFRK